MIRLKRVYDLPEPDDGYRVLVDRLWPRGLKREAAKIDAWLKDIAPSPALRTWYGHDADRFEEFAERYREELGAASAEPVLADLAARAQRQTVTLLYAARETRHNSASVLKLVLEKRLKK